MAAGGELIIDDKLLKSIENLEKSLSKITNTSNEVERGMQKWLTQINNSNITDFVSNLNKVAQANEFIHSTLNKLGDKNPYKTLSNDAKNAVDNANRLITVLQQTKEYQVESSAIKNREGINTLYAEERMRKAIREELTRTQSQELEHYQRIRNEIRTLESIKKEASKVKNTTEDPELKKDAINTYKEASKQLKYYKEQEKQLRQKYSVEIEQIEKDAAMRGFTQRAKIAKQAADAVAKEIEREKQLYLKSLNDQSLAEQRYQERMQKLQNMRDTVERKVKDSADKDTKKTNEAYLKELDKQIQKEQEYQERMRLLKERRASVDAEAARKVDAEIKKETEAYLKDLERRIKAEQEYLKRTEEIARQRVRLKAETEAGVMSDKVAQRTGGKAWNVDAEEAFRRLRAQQKKESEYVRNKKAMYASMFDEIERMEEISLRRRRAINAKYGDSSKGALNYANRLYSAQGVRSIQNMETALNKLRDAQRRLNVGTEEGRKRYDELGAQIKKIEGDLNRVTNASERMRKSHSGLINTGQQLARQLALVFSVSQIEGYINKIVQVRKEFELQQKALGAILRDQDKGNELWNQTIQLAVKSPFRVKELITYTKQLAAYRIETDKLHDTTKMLADVSAGLGVDMNRLILAYGQVRAAEYLRGTELRQFTEAGIPLLAELAEHFTKLEGRAVSTADVFEMISKRMVTFADVSQVFQKMTSEGGVFFQMQEKQSETLHGLINNLYDSVDLMMNAIGKENEGTIVGFLKSVKSLAESWREVAVRINDIGTVLLLAKSAQWAFTTSFNRGMAMNKMSLLGLNLGIKESTISFNKWIATLSIAELKTLGFSTKTALLQKAFAGIKVAAMGAANALASFLPIAIIYGLYELYMALTKASREAERLRKELSSAVSVDVADLDKAIVRYENLANRLGMVNKGSMAHKEIISALNKEYGEYLDFLVNEETTVAQLNAAYDNLVETMRQKQSMEAFQKGMDTIAEHYRTQITEANKTFKDEFGKIGQLELKTTDNNQYLIPTGEEVEHIFNLINQKIRETKDVTSIDDLTEQRDLLNSVIEEFYGKDITLLGADYDNLKFIELMVNQRKEELQLQKEIDAQFRKSLKTRAANLALTALQNKYEEDKLKIVNKTTSEFEKQEELSKLKDKFELDVIDLKLRFNIIGDQEASEEKDKILNWAKGTIGDINETIKSELGSTFSGEELSKVLFTRELKETKTIANYLKDLKTSWESQNKVIAEQISLKSELGELDENNEKILQDALRKEELYRRTLKLLGVEIQYTERLSEETRIAVNSLEGLPTEMQISLEQAYGGIDNILSGLKKKETEQLNIIRQLNELKKNGLPYDEQRLKMAELIYGWTKKLQDLIDPNSKTAIAEDKVAYINSKLKEKYQIGSIDKTKDEVTLLSEANTAKEAAIAYEKQLNAQKAMGLAITQEQLDNAKEETEQTTLKWKLLGGIKEEGGGKGRTNSLYDERIKVIDDMNKKYKELNRTLDKTNSLQGAFDAYKDAFAEAFAGIKWIPKNVQSMSPQEFVAQVLNFPSEDDLVKFLDKLAEEPMKTFEKIKVELAKGKYVYDMKVRAKVEEDEKLIQSIEDMFGTYELSLELKDMNIPTDLAEKLFNFESIDLSELRQKALDELGIKNQAGTDAEIINRLKEDGTSKERIKLTEDTLKKIADMEAKALEERMKKYAKFLEQEQTERVKIKLNEVRQLMEIEDTFRIHEKDARENYGLSDEQWKAYEKQRKAGQEINLEFLKGLGIEEEKAQAILEQNRLLAEQKQLAYTGVNRTTQENLDKDTWESFKKSGYYEMMFSDLEHLGTKAIDSLYEKLSNMQDALKQLPPEVYKEIQSTIDKVESIKLERNPFEALKDAWKEVRDLNKNGIDVDIADPFFGTSIDTKNIKGEEEIAEEYARQEERLAQLREEEAIVAAVLAVKQGTATIDQQQLTQTQEAQGYLDKQESDLNVILKGKQKEKKLTEQNAKALKNGVDAYQGMSQAVSASWKKTGQWAEAIKNTADATDALLDSLGVAEDSAARIAVQAVSMTADMILNVVQLQIQFKAAGIAANDMLGIIGWIAMGLQALAKVFSFIFGLHDAKLQKQIENLEKSVESLAKEYEKLEKAIENTYSAADLDVYTETAQANLQQQIDGYKKMIELERDKKKTDEEAIADWYDQIEEKEKQAKELEAKRLQELGGLGDEASYKEASESFVDAWLSAFKETGDGMKGLEEAWDEMVHNMVKQQLLTRGVDKIMTGFYDKWDEAIDSGGIDEKEWDALNALMAEKREQLDEYLKGMTQNMGVEEMAGQGELDTLQKGIQGITEDQADILASYLNSIRFMVGEQVGYLKKIAGVDTATEEVQQNYNPTLTTSKAIEDLQKSISQQEDNNPMIPHLKTIAEQTSAIHALLDSVTLSGHTRGGQGIKVFMD